MELKDLIKYSHTEWIYKPNKLAMPKQVISIETREEWNEVYKFAYEHYMQVKPTKSKSMPYNFTCRRKERYMTVVTRTGFELVICCLNGCYRFICGNGVIADDNPISGTKALKTIYKTAKTFGVLDTFIKDLNNAKEGSKIKETIKHPLIAVCESEYEHKEFLGNVHHIDLNSSYASRIVEKYPELKEMYEWLYNNRKQNNGYFKSVLNNSIGAMQSQYCISPRDSFTKMPYGLSKFSKIAIDGTVDKILDLIVKLTLSGRKPLLLNTDGIWYKGSLYHDNDEGTKLGQWKHDYSNCDLYIKSKGAYQIRTEEGKVISKVRGYTSLDSWKSREDWQWKEIENQYTIRHYELIEGQGIEEIWD